MTDELVQQARGGVWQAAVHVSFKANSNSFEEQLIDLKPHFNSAEALVTQRLKIVPTSSHGVFPRMRISV